MIIVGKFITPSIISSSSQDDQHSSPRHFQELQFQVNLKKTSEEDDSSSKVKKRFEDQRHEPGHQQKSQSEANSKKTSADEDPKNKKMTHSRDQSPQHCQVNKVKQNSANLQTLGLSWLTTPS